MTKELNLFNEIIIDEMGSDFATFFVRDRKYMILRNGNILFRYSNDLRYKKKAKLFDPKDNYSIKYLTLSIFGTTLYFHRLKYFIFNGEIKSGMVIDHIDGNKKNNDIGNLRQKSQKENIKSSMMRGVKQGKAFYSGSLSKKDVHNICKLIMNGVKNGELSKKYNLDPSRFSRIRNNRIYRDISCKYW